MGSYIIQSQVPIQWTDHAQIPKETLQEYLDFRVGEKFTPTAIESLEGLIVMLRSKGVADPIGKMREMVRVYPRDQNGQFAESCESQLKQLNLPNDEGLKFHINEFGWTVANLESRIGNHADDFLSKISPYILGATTVYNAEQPEEQKVEVKTQ